MHLLARILCAAMAISLLAVAPPASSSPSLAGGGGLDWYEGPGGQTTRAVLAIAGAELGGGSTSLTLMRYEDDVSGDGVGFVGSVQAPLATDRSLCGWASHFVGDGSLRAWRVKVGPLAELPSGGTAGVFYTHAEDNAGGRSDAGAAELSLPLVSRLTGRVAAAYGTAPGGMRSALGSMGLGWSPVHGLELTGDVGVARNGALTMSPASPQGPLTRLLGFGGNGGGNAQEARVDPVLQFGLRVLLP